MRHLIGLRGHANTIISTTDVTPNAVNWSSVGFSEMVGFFTYSERQITGINTTITLKVDYDMAEGDLYYYVSSTAGAIGSGDFNTFLAPYDTVAQYISSGTTFTVSNNQYVTFGVDGFGGTVDSWVTVTNVSNSNTTLDTFGLFYSL